MRHLLQSPHRRHQNPGHSHLGHRDPWSLHPQSHSAAQRVGLAGQWEAEMSSHVEVGAVLKVELEAAAEQSPRPDVTPSVS